MKREDAIKMFGCSMEELDHMEKHNIYTSMHGEGLGSIWLACSILSDAQEVMASGNTECARQFINKAKHLLFNLMDKENVR
jgi:hypothetical protein